MSTSRPDEIMGSLFDIAPHHQPETSMPNIVPEDPNAALWGDRWTRKDISDANQKPYGRPDNPAGDDSFDPDVAKEATDRAVELADEHANPAWKDMFTASLRIVAQQMPEFTTDEVWEHIGTLKDPPTTGEKRAVGALIRKAAKDGVIAYKTDCFRRSRRANCHKSIIQVYESRIYEQASQ